MKKLIGILCLFAAPVANAIDQKELECLTKNIIYEARSEGLTGMMAVASVTMNRVKSKHYPNTICKVVYQPYQFSWTHQPKQKLRKSEKDKIRAAYIVAKKYVKGIFKDNTGGALWYHTKAVNPYWNRKMTVTKIHKSHIFYRK